MFASGLLTADSGSVLFDGRDVGRMSSREAAEYRRRDVGFVFQAFHLMPGSSAVENALIKLPISGYTQREAREIATVWLERLGLAVPTWVLSSINSRWASASGSPSHELLRPSHTLLLADEPTSNLDSVRSREILSLLRDGCCRERNIPGLLVTHDRDAINFVDRSVHLRDGVIADGPGVSAPAA